MDPPQPRPEDERAARTRESGRTVPQEAFSPEGLRAHLARTGPTAARQLPDPRAGTSPLIERPSLAERLRRFGHRAPGPPLGRFEVESVLGVGATARVYAVRDRNLERAVAVKFLVGDGDGGADAIDHFIQEAQITAALEHPNVLPVHELDVNDAGQVFFTMKKIDGRSFGALLEQAAAGVRPPAIADANAIVNIVLGAAQALAYAHARGIVHQDVKPDNIMVGEFGEVLLVDWGSAVRLAPGERPRLYGTPLYMSPEQARGEGVDARSDVYCLGATLFHALTLRCPTWSDDAEEFWRLKRAGAIRPPSDAERAASPTLLLDIALKALAPDPAQRYPSAAELLADLRRYQAGLAVSAHRDTWREKIARWHRRHWRALWSTAAIAAVVIGLGATLYGEKLKEIATWGTPLVTEDFADGSWRDRWGCLAGSFTQRDGRIVSSDSGATILVWPHKLWGPVALEYDAEILADASPGDISAFWTRDYDAAKKEQIIDGYRFQVGAFDGAYSAIRTSEGRHLASEYFRPRPGQRYHIRVEVEDYRLTLAVDGRVICTWTDTMRFDGGYVGLYAYYEGKAFSRLRIFTGRTAQKVPATAVGDAFLRLKQYREAMEQYARVADAFADLDLGHEALFKQGLCLWEQGERDPALTLWRRLAGTAYAPQVRLYEVDRDFEAGDRERALAELEDLYRASGADMRRRVAMQWGNYLDRLRVADDGRLLARYLDAHERTFSGEPVVDINAADALSSLHRYEELLSRFPHQRRQCAWALIELHRNHEVVENYPDQRTTYHVACFLTGEWERFRRVPGDRFFLGQILVKEGHPTEALAEPAADAYARWLALCALGRLDDAMALAADDPAQRARTLMLLGREQEAALVDDTRSRLRARLALDEPLTVLATSGGDEQLHSQALLLSGLDEYMHGDAEAGSRAFASARATGPADEMFIKSFVAPFLEHPGDRAAWASAAEVALGDRWNQEQTVWYMARYLTGAIDEAAFLAQPHRMHTDARLLLLRGFRRERDGRIDDALADYRAYAALPRWRRGSEVDVLAERWVAWRIQALSTR